MVFDTKPGGIGICYAAFQMIFDVIKSAFELLQDCKCGTGCPTCVHDFQCPEYNERMDKIAARNILQVGNKK